MYGFNGRIYLEGKGIVRGSIGIENGKFVSVDYDPTFENIDERLMIVPGFIDEHMHGANGSDVMDASEESLRNIADSVTRDGVTAFLATTMTMEDSSIVKALENVRDFRNGSGAEIIGIHLEGPFISPDYCGAQNKDAIRKPDGETLKRYAEISGHKIRMVTFAPEEADLSFFETAEKERILMSAGHCAAGSETMEKAIGLGVSSTTHTFNAMRGIHHRDIGAAGTALLNDDLYCEVICDLHHVCPQAIRLLLKSKPRDRILLITDSMEARFLEDGVYHLGGQEVSVREGTARLKNGTLAGSVLRMNVALKNMKQVSGRSMEEIVDMASLFPARHLNIDHRKGSIAVGKDADFAMIDENFTVYKTFVGGKEVFSKED